MEPASLISAGVGLTAAIIGGTITAISNWVLCHRKELADEKREKSLRDARILVASREIGEDLIDGAAAANLMLEEHCEWESLDGKINLDSWQEHRGALAAQLTDEEWVKVTTAVAGIKELRGHILAHNSRAANPENPSQEEVRIIIEEIEQGRQVLKVYRNARSWLSRLEPEATAAL